MACGCWVFSIRPVARRSTTEIKWILGITSAKVALFLHQDFSRTGPGEVFTAPGQCLFLTALAASYIMVYGEFMRDDSSLQFMALLTTLSLVNSFQCFCRYKSGGGSDG